MAGKWEQATADADDLQGKLGQLSTDARFRALRYMGQSYTAAATRGVAGTAEKAESVYKIFLKDAGKSNPSSTLEALNNLAYLFADGPNANVAKALDYGQQAYDLMTKANYIDPTIADTYGWALVLNKQIDKGIDVLQAVTARDDKLIPDAHYHLAEAYLKKAQVDQARESINQARVVLKRAKDRGAYIDPMLETRIDGADKRIKDAEKSGNSTGSTVGP
jgi:tetratricopeptide (TPR) repeat protein